MNKHPLLGFGQSADRRGLLVFFLLGFVLFWQILSVDIYPYVTNDGIGFLGHSQDFSQYGLVRDGYRQFGYPLFLKITTNAADFFAFDPLSLVVVIQRGLYFIALLYLLYQFGLLALPLLLVLTHPHIIALTNMFLTESLGLSLTIILVTGVLTLFQNVEADNSRLTTITKTTIACLALIAAYALRPTYLALAVLCVPMFVYYIRADHRCSVMPIALMTTTGLGCAILVLFVSLENQREMNRFTPATSNGRAIYYGAYQAVFKYRNEFTSRPEMADYYNDGDVYVFISSVDRAPVEYPEKKRMFEAKADELFKAAELSRPREALTSSLNFAKGARANDVGGMTRRITSPDDGTKRANQFPNFFVRRDGEARFLQVFNNGSATIFVTTSGIFKSIIRVPLLPIYAAALVACIVTCVVVAFLRRGVTRIALLSILFIYVAICLVYGIQFIDNWRYTLVNFGTIGVGALFAIKRFWYSREMRGSQAAA